MVNRPTNITNNNTVVNRTSNRNQWFGGNNNYGNRVGLPGQWGGGNWGGRSPGYGGNYRRPYYGGNYGSWYRGSWNRSYFGPGYGGFGPGYGGYGYGYGGGLFNTFPSWGLPFLSGWGLGSLTSGWLNSGYSNPYYTTPVVNQTIVQAAPVPVYDYSQPLNVASAPPEATVAEQGQALFNSARDAFMAGDYPRALDQTDQALTQLPNDPVLHEFRALVFFAMQRYDEAAATLYAVLSAGPGWNWSTMISLYPEVDIYTNQLRALEAATKQTPSSAANHFVLAYHYMVQGHAEQSRAQFQQVVNIKPTDVLSAKFVTLLAPESAAEPAGDPPAAALAAEEAPPAEPAAEPLPEELPAVPASLVGTWKASPEKDVSIVLTIKEDSTFEWVVTTPGKPETITGTAGFANDVLTLLQNDGPPLEGTIANQTDQGFQFKLPGPDGAPSLQFTK